MGQQFFLYVCIYGLLCLLFIESMYKNVDSVDKHQVDNYDCLKRGRGMGLGMRIGEFQLYVPFFKSIQSRNDKCVL